MHHQPHQSALAADLHVGEIGLHRGDPRPRRGAGQQREPGAALGHQRLPVGQEPDVPRVLEARGDDLDGEIAAPDRSGQRGGRSRRGAPRHEQRGEHERRDPPAGHGGSMSGSLLRWA